jgi:hypothetical protein
MCSLSFPASAQADEKLIQLSGVVRDQTLHPLQFVHILILNKARGTISDTRGMFSFVVQPHDTIVFSAVGYKRTGLIIPDTLKTFHYPEFKQAFVSLELPDDDLEKAFHNLAMIHSQIHNPEAAPDPDLNYQYHLREQYNATYSKGQYPYYTIFDPMRWAEFIEYLKEGKFRNPDRNK